VDVQRASWLFALFRCGWLFCWPFLVGQSCFGYRDTQHLYPLFEWIQINGAAANSLWNSLDDFWQPLLPTAFQRFYPLKAIFFLTALCPTPSALVLSPFM
jgi:hypothetical protein